MSRKFKIIVKELNQIMWQWLFVRKAYKDHNNTNLPSAELRNWSVSKYRQNENQLQNNLKII
jgi:hypothetical protein